MWTISDEQIESIEMTMLEEYFQRVCSYVYQDEKFSSISRQQLRESAEKVLDDRMRMLLEDEKNGAEFLKLTIGFQEKLTPTYSREVRLVLDEDSMSGAEKIEAISNIVNN